MTKNTVVKGCIGGCLGLVVLFVLFVVGANFIGNHFAPGTMADIKAKNAADVAEMKRQQAADIDHFLANLHDLSTRLPGPDAIKEALCPASSDPDDIQYQPADDAFFTQFATGTFQPVPSPEHLWYRGGLLAQTQQALTSGKTPPVPDKYALGEMAKYFKKVPYLLVFMPDTARWPVLSADDKTFEPGVFRGWAVLVDAKTMTPLGQTPFDAQNSAKVTSLRVGLGHALVGADLKTAIENDFTDNFWKAADAAVVHLREHPGGKTTAAHTDNFPDPK